MTGVIYARYLSDNQREESIEGQLRECKVFAEKNGIQIIDTYIDRAMSTKTDNRPDFQKMIKDSAKQQSKNITLINERQFKHIIKYDAIVALNDDLTDDEQKELNTDLILK